MMSIIWPRVALRHKKPPSMLVASAAVGGSNALLKHLGSAKRFCSFTSEYNKDTHPREYAIWRQIDRDHDGMVSNKELRLMCRRLDAIAHADVLCAIMDPESTGETTFKHFCKNFRVVQMVRNTARLKGWNRTFGLGVAGNVAGHMAQAGEAEQDTGANTLTPAAIFTFYAPHPHSVEADEDDVLSRLEHFPVTNTVIDYPRNLAGASNVQVEPEMGLYCDIVYSIDGLRVERLVPRRIAAFNDCSIRTLDGSEKLSEKKNWGFGSKGISLRSFRVSSISKGTLVDRLVLVSYIKRDGNLHPYSVAAPARNYLMFHDSLLMWIVKQINEQQNIGKWEEIFPQLLASDFPTSVWIALGAGEYTDWGAENFLLPKDQSLVIIYDEEIFPGGPDTALVNTLFDEHDAPEGMIALVQTFV